MNIATPGLAALLTTLALGLLSACGNGAPAPTPTATPAHQATPEVGVRVGNLAPAFTVTSVDGEEVSLNGLLAQEQPFLLYFFTTW